MLQRMGSQELIEWWAFYQLEPWGCEVDFYRGAIIASTVANTNRGKGKAAKVEDFMPKFQRKQEQSIDQAVNFVTMLNAAFGGEDKRNG